MPEKPLDVLAQQIAAEVACGEWDEDALFDLIGAHGPIATLTREEYAGSRADAGRGLLDAARPQPCAGASRRRQPQAAAAPGPAADRDHLRRHHSGHRRLQRRAGARRTDRRHGERRLRGREHGRRHLPARQHVVSHSCASKPAACASRTRTACRPRSRSGSAKRRRAPTRCRPRCRACAKRSARGSSNPGDRVALSGRTGRRRQRCRRAGRRLLRRRQGRARLAADSAAISCSSASSTKPAARSS